MKTVLFFVCAFFIVILLGACSGNPTANEQSTVAEKKEEAAEEKTSNTTLDIINDYIKLKDALVASNAKQAQQVAVALLEVIDAIQMPEMQQNIKEIAATEDLTLQRTYFDSLSMEVYQMAKTAETDIPALYRQFCPMAFDNRGAYWLSFHKEIRNPYFGDQMLTCGRVEEEIK